MRILDLYAGAGGERRRKNIEARGHTYLTLDIDPDFGCNLTADIFKINAKFLGPFDFVWASPPCEAFSVASIGHHWAPGYTPKTDAAKTGIKLLERTLEVLKIINPEFWIIENPRGMMRKLPMLSGFPRATVTYCQYGDTRMKPTDLWSNRTDLEFRPMCHNGDPCHEAAPRGSKTGTQGIDGADERAVVPWELWEDLLKQIEGKYEERIFGNDRKAVQGLQQVQRHS